MKEEREELEFEEEEESEELEYSKGAIITKQGDPEIESLHRRYKRGKLVLQPDFQRRFVWDTKQSSRLIESALLDIPLPLIYLSEELDEKEYVIDGQQRLTAFFSFIDGKFPDGKLFKFTGLNVFSELKNKSFQDLEEKYQDKIMYYQVRTITFKKESSVDLKFEVFERLNTGSVSLNDQEMRNCIYRGAYNQVLLKLSQYPDFMKLLALRAPHKRMKDVELVLRFAAFYHATYLNYRSSMRKFLNDDMIKYQHISETDAHNLEEAFKRAITLAKSLFDIHAFKRFHKGDRNNPDGYWELQKFNVALYDILMFSFANADKGKIYHHLDTVRETFIHLMTNDQEFIDTISFHTNDARRVRTRFKKWLEALQAITDVTQKEPRCFSLHLKEQLYQDNSTCAICGQRIQTIDDAEIDHIEQYWIGGKTIPENARLTHRFCNRSRPLTETKQDQASEYTIIPQTSQGNKTSHQDAQEAITLPKAPHIPIAQASQKKKRRHRASQGEITTQKTFDIPILETLIEQGGQGRAKKILAQVEMKMKGTLTQHDYETIPSGNAIRWKRTAEWSAKRMRDTGLLCADSPRGIWEISENGEKYLAEQSLQIDKG